MNYEKLYGKAALFVGADKPFEVKEYPVAPPPEGCALLKLSASGVCGTDVHIHHGRLGIAAPMIIGHEFIGEVVDVNCSDSGVKVGDSVIFNMAKPCGKCRLCQTGDSANCLAFEVAYAKDPEEAPHFHGGYGEYCYARAGRDDGALIKLPDGVSAQAAVMFPCAGPTVIHALKLGGLFESGAAGVECAVVQGAGPLGLFASIWLTQMGVPKIYTVLRETGGRRAENIRAMSKAEPITSEKLGELVAGGLSVDLCIECSGNPSAFLDGVNALRNRGIYLIPGQYSDSGSVSFGPQVITFKALQLIGSSQYDASDVSDYIAFLDANRELLPKLEREVGFFTVEQINEALSAAESHEYSKVALR